MDNEPLRADVVEFAPTENVTVPLPLPLEPFVIVIHAVAVVAVHAHPAGAVTENVLVAVPDPKDRLVGDTAYVHDIPDWLTLTVWPPMDNELLRADVVEFAPTENVTVPLPLPLDPLVIVIHAAEVVAVHAHPTGAVTENVLVPPVDPSDRLVGETV